MPLRQWKSPFYSRCGHCTPPLSGAVEFASFRQRLYDYTRNQVDYNGKMDVHFPPGTHPFGSRWWSWPMALRGIKVRHTQRRRLRSAGF